MKNRSRKAKSTKLQNLVRAKILKSFTHLKKKDIVTLSIKYNDTVSFA